MINLQKLKFEKSNNYLNTQLQTQTNNKQLILDIITNIGLFINNSSNIEEQNKYEKILLEANTHLQTISSNIIAIEQLNLEITSITKELSSLLEEKNKSAKTKEFYVASFSNVRHNIVLYSQKFQELEKKLNTDNVSFNEFININNFKYNFNSVLTNEEDDANYEFAGFSINESAENILEDTSHEAIENEENLRIDQLTNEFKSLLINLSSGSVPMESSLDLLTSYIEDIKSNLENKKDIEEVKDLESEITENIVENNEELNTSSDSAKNVVKELESTDNNLENSDSNADISDSSNPIPNLEDLLTNINNTNIENLNIDKLEANTITDEPLKEVSDEIEKEINTIDLPNNELKTENNVEINEDNQESISKDDEFKTNYIPHNDNLSSDDIDKKVENILKAEVDNEDLIISEKRKTIYLTYKISELLHYVESYPNVYTSLRDVVNQEFVLPFNYFVKHPYKSRFSETYNIIRNREGKGFIQSVSYSVNVAKRNNLNPAVVAACKTQTELESYLYYLDSDNLKRFNFFNIIYEVNPLKEHKRKNR